MTSDPATYPGSRFPAEIIIHPVWLHHVFSLSLRDGADFARKLRRRRPKPGGT